MQTRPVVSIVGRPNVGKSTLFNRLVGSRKAITEDSPGVTRDRNYGEFEHRGREFILIDTGGFEPESKEGFSPLIARQIEVSIDESDLIVFLLDGKEGLLPEDKEISDNLRRYGLPVLYVVNKIDSEKREQEVVDFFGLGPETLHAVSAQHGLGIYDLLDAIYEATPRAAGEADGSGKEAGEEEESKTLRIALVGRPNTGKSSLANRLIGAERMIVSDVPGTTRDAIDTKVTYKGKEIVLVDTAGLRRKSKISQKVEGYSVASALKSIDRAHVVNLIIDAGEGPSHQDGAIAYTILDRGKGMCIVVNKWDLAPVGTDATAYTVLLRERIPHGDFCPVVFTSALTGRSVQKILDTDIRIYQQLQKKISTPKVNRAFEEFFHHHSIPNVKGKQIKIFYGHQLNTPPPTFVLYANQPDLIPEHYRRYLQNALREKFGFEGVPIRLLFRKKN